MSQTNRSLVVSIIGRPNVGKSTLFNRLMGKMNKVITYDSPGVTRDRHYGIISLTEANTQAPKDVILIDTGGFYPEKVDEDAGGRKKDKHLPSFFNLMRDHAKIAISESDLVLLIVDAREGVIPFDHTIMRVIRESKKTCWVIVNKADSDELDTESYQFYSLGVNEDELVFLSAAHARGVMEFKLKLHQHAIDFSYLSCNSGDLQKGVTPRSEVIGKLAIIGAPNAGKSTLLNRLIGSERALVSDIAGTTVDPIEGFFDLYMGPTVLNLASKDYTPDVKDTVLIEQYEEFRKNNKELLDQMEKSMREETFLVDHGTNPEPIIKDKDEELFERLFSQEDETPSEADEAQGNYWRSFHLVDTAGIRRQTNVEGFIEEQSVYRALRCITESDIVIYVVDSLLGVGHQDRRLIDLALDKGKSIVIALNKFDLLKEKYKTNRERKEWLKDLRAELPWLDFCDLVQLSAKTGDGLKRLKTAIKHTILIRKQKLPTGELNRLLMDLVDRHPIVVDSSGGGRRYKVKYATMVRSAPPTIILFSNRSKGIPDHYTRYLKNGIRAHFALANTPIHLIFRSGTDLDSRMKRVGSK